MKLYINIKTLDKIILNLYVDFLKKSLNCLKITNFKIQNLPTKVKRITLLKSPHVNKKARDQFQLCAYKRLLDIYSSSSKTVDALMKLELPSGVEVEIKV